MLELIEPCNDNPSPAPATTDAARFGYNSREKVIKSSYKRGRFRARDGVDKVQLDAGIREAYV